MDVTVLATGLTAYVVYISWSGENAGIKSPAVVVRPVKVASLLSAALVTPKGIKINPRHKNIIPKKILLFCIGFWHGHN